MLRWTLPIVLSLALVGCADDDDSTPVEETGTEETGDTEVTQNDTDGDGILDVHEGDGDADGDGKPNLDDRDSDGDTIKDKIEAGDSDPFTLPIDSDGDGVEDYLDLDSDNNCLSDEAEKGGDIAIDTDGDGVRDFADTDNDGDGILDIDEIGDTEACNAVDTDADGTPDYMDQDSDGDGIGDVWEAGNTIYDTDPVDTDGDGTPDYQDDDSDNDGIPDDEEAGGGTIDQEPSDTDGDGLYDFQDTDADGDGLSDADELGIYGTDPYDFDSDNDGFSDGGEVLAGTDPLDSESVIDGVYVEVGERTEVEEVFTFELRIQRGDIAFLVDTTCSMGSTAQAMGTQYASIVSELEDTFDDAAYGFATYDDYAYGSFGSSGSDLPFELRIGVTTDTSAVDAVLASVPIHSGADGPESSVEALYQSASGAGYDQNCNGNYDVLTDVLPWIADASDPFGGSDGENYDASLPDAGIRGGFGFREYALPVVIYATDNYLRDPDSTNPSYNSTPGGCPIDAGSSDVVTAFEDLGGYIIGADVSGSNRPYPQMLDIAERTASYADTDGDGEADDPLVFTLSQSSIGFDSAFTNGVVQAVEQLVDSIKFEDITLEIDGDAYGFVTSISPESYTDLADYAAADLDFTLTFRGVVAATSEDQLFKLSLLVIGDGTTLLDELDIIVLVPGSSF